MELHKFGGTSVRYALKNIYKIIHNKKNVIVVVSALAGITNLCKNICNGNYDSIDCIKNIHLEYINTYIKNKDSSIELLDVYINNLQQWILNPILYKHYILSTGERLSSNIIYNYLQEQQLDITLVKDPIIYKNNRYNIEIIKEHFILPQSNICIVPGFIGYDENHIITLGRGGSDLTATILARVFDIKLVILWTDISGVLPVDPKYIILSPIKTITYNAMKEFAYFGAKIVYSRCIEPLEGSDICIAIKNTFKLQEEGTLIIPNKNSPSKLIGCTVLENCSLITIKGNDLLGKPGILSTIFKYVSSS